MDPSSNKLSHAAGLLLISMSLLALQVAATRVFSLMIWYHFAFLVISIAFLGFTCGGLLVFVRRKTWLADPTPVLARSATLGSIGTALMFIVACRLPFTPFFGSPEQILLFAILIILTLVPFFFCGLCICLTLSSWPRNIHVFYFVNLAGSGLGCAVIIILLDRLGVPSSVFASGMMAWFAALAYERGSGRSLGIKGAAWRAFVTALWILLTVVATNPLHPIAYMPNAKFLPRVERSQILKRKCDSLSCVDFFENPKHAGIWGLSPHFNENDLPPQIGVVIDSWAITSIFSREALSEDPSVLEYLPSALVHQLGPFNEVLVIGCGGGVDVLTALHYGAGHVTGVDINPIIIGAVLRDYSDWAGKLYEDPRVDVLVSEGRHFLKASTGKFDMIQLSGVDTFAASQAGAFALHENYLYTTEAFHDLLDALNPGGVITLTRWIYSPPRQTLKLVSIIEKTLRERNAVNPQDQFAVFSSDVYSIIILKNEPMTRQEVELLEHEVGAKGYTSIYLPYKRINPYEKAGIAFNPYYKFWDEGPDKFIEDYPFDIRPTTDDHPFFFEHNRWSKLLYSGVSDLIFSFESAQMVLLVALVITGVFCAAILFAARRYASGMPGSLGAAGHLYFAALGLGYIFIENVLVQRMILYLGNPSYALSVILFGLLLFSGAGSALAGRLTVFRRHARLFIFAIGLVLACYTLILRPVLELVLGAPLSLRILAVLALVALPGVLMGMPFPMGMDKIGAINEKLVPWAWVVNGAASVIGGVITVMIGITWGFSVIFVSAAAFYFIAATMWKFLAPQKK